METYKQMTDALGMQLLLCAKQKKDKPLHLKNAEDLLESGADVNYKNSRPIYFAVKNYNFTFVKLLIRYGALKSELSRKYLSAMCERGGFNDKREDAFFDLIDYAVSKTGFDLDYLAAYINMTLVAGRVDKLCAAAEKFSVGIPRALSCVRLMIIFEAVNLDRKESLRLIDAYVDWMDGAIDLATATGEDKVVDYVLAGGKILPREESVVKAITAGHAKVLEVLHQYGIDLKKPVYIKAACHGFTRFPEPLKFLTSVGAHKAGYDGKSVYENTVAEGNKDLLMYLRTMRVGDL